MVVSKSQVSVASSLGSTVYDSPRKRREPKVHSAKADVQQIRRMSHGSGYGSGSGSGSFSSRKAKSVPELRQPREQREIKSLPSRPFNRSVSSASHLITTNSRVSAKTAPAKLPPRPNRPTSMSRTRKGSHTSTPGLPRPARSKSASSIGSMPRTLSKSSSASRVSNDGRKTFHVRLSVGYLTGIQIDQTKRKKSRNSNQIVTGYAELAKSKDQIVSSQPLVTDILGGLPSKPVKLFWGRPRTGQNSESAAKERKLYFSIRMEQCEHSSSLDDDDNSQSSQATYSPEVVKVVVGLKCGEERVPLGVANLVVNGANTIGQKVYLAVRPVSESSERKTPRRGIFGSNKKHTPSSFPNGQHCFSLASNSTLRVTVDVKQANTGEENGRAWSQSGDDDDSYATFGSTSLDARQAHQVISRRNKHQKPQQLSIEDRGDDDAAQSGCQIDAFSLDRSFMTDLVEAMPDFSATSIEMAKSFANQLLLQGSYPKTAPMKFIIYRKPEDGISMASGLTELESDSNAHNPNKSIFPMACWGRQIARASSFEDELLGDHHDFALDGDKGTGMDEYIVERGSPELSVIKHRSHPAARSRSSGNLDVISRSSSDLGDDATTDDETTEEGTAEFTLDTLTDLKEAQETLLRYANKVGVNMEDLLGESDQRVGRRRRLEEERE